MLPKKKKPNLKGKKKQADQVFSLIIRSVGKCANCDSTYRLQCAHIISRGYLNLRWDIRNAVCLCSSCHIFYTFRPLEWDDWVNERIGKDVHDGLKREAKAIHNGKIFYDDLIQALKRTLRTTLDK